MKKVAAYIKQDNESFPIAAKKEKLSSAVSLKGTVNFSKKKNKSIQKYSI